jgi:primosomal protein N' (replication factor Y)
MVADALGATVGGGFAPVLLDGPPGSGKTEVYLEAIARALAAGRQTLVLLPEIALGAQWLARFRARFGVPPVSWHSDVAAGERRRAWRAVLSGEAPVVVGARSALFLPFADLGLIVVDEEHDASFKQEDGVAYHARDMAVVRARLAGIPVILASATPSLETWTNVLQRRYRRLGLPARTTVAAPPPIGVVDLTRDRPAAGDFVAPAVHAAVAETVGRGEQALLFLNRRGYAPLTLCRGCGHRFACVACTAWLVEHRAPRRLVCHHCGMAAPVPAVCPACGEAALAACGPGVERLAEEVAGHHPGIRLGIATSDTLPGPLAAADLVRRIEAHDLDVIIGTQVVAKGHHFPLLTLVAIIDADVGLSGGDLRAGERTFQLLTQVAGRAGRAERAGRVLVQTTLPAHPVIRTLVARDRGRFLAAEADARREAGLPPFGRLAALIVSAADAAAVDAAAALLARQAPAIEGGRILGPAPAPLARLRGRHRRRFLLMAPLAARLSPVVRAWTEAVRLPAAVRLQVDIDPQSFL